MNNIINLWKPFFLALMAVLYLSSCVDQDFDEPPTSSGNPDIPTESIVSIESIKEMYTLGEIQQLSSDKYISGVITANDLTGNFYKVINIQDETAGIPLQIDATNLAGQYAVGRRVYVKLDGLYLDDYEGYISLGGSLISADRVGGIPEVLLEDIVLLGEYNQEITPIEITDISQLTNDLLGSLVIIKEAQFSTGDAGETYADQEQLQSLNRQLELCSGGNVTVRSSGYATFAGDLTPEGSGSITGIYSIFRDTRQLIIRGPEEVVFGEERCDGSGGGGGGTVEGTPISIEELKDLFTGSDTPAPDGRKITGIVISDVDNSNLQSKNVIIQNGDDGITVRFNTDNPYELGEEIEISTEGATLSEFRGLLQLGGVDVGNSTSVGTGSITPQTLTIAEILSMEDELMNTLVKIEEVTITKDGGSDYAFGTTLNDGTGTLDMFTQSYASFANENFPTGTVTITGIIGKYDDVQINIRNTGDVESDGGGGGGGDEDPDLVSIATIKDLYQSGNTGSLPNYKIRGIVISDAASGNITGRNLVLQDGDSGITLRFDEEHSFALGDELEVVVDGASLGDYNGLVQVDGLSLADDATNVGTGNIEPLTLTIAEYLNNEFDYQSTLVRFENVTFSGASELSGALTLTDDTGSIETFIRNQANFAGTPVPTGAVDVVAIGSNFNGPQVIFRNSSDF